MHDYTSKFAVKSDAETALSPEGTRLTPAQCQELRRWFMSEYQRCGEGANGAGPEVVWYNAVRAILTQYSYEIVKKNVVDNPK